MAENVLAILEHRCLMIALAYQIYCDVLATNKRKSHIEEL